MKLSSKSSLIFAGIAMATFALGWHFGSRAAGRQPAEVIKDVTQSLTLSDASLRTTHCVVALRAIREGRHDAATQFLETSLNRAVIELAREYTPEHDLYGSAAQSLTQAKEYRVAHPHTSSIASVAKEIQAALETPVVLPKAE